MLATWRDILDHLASPPSHDRRLYDMTEPLFRLQRILGREELQTWTKNSAGKLRALNAEPLALILEANALLYSRQYTDEQAIALFLKCRQELLNHKIKENFPWYDHQKISQFPGLLAKIRTQSMPPPQKTQPTSPILASTRDEVSGHSYFLTVDDFDYKVTRQDQLGRSIALATFPRMIDDESHSRRQWQIQTSAPHVAITDSQIVYAGTSGVLNELRRFPFQIKSLVLDSNRIYLAGDRTVMSSNFSGENRQILFSATQTDQALDFQKLHPEYLV
ncbi:MAG: hypothetical protein PHS41_11205, partial [Victivallaceae bacterium]|nr:hypothetical protein [Victivallaceae bacterium]